jgi:hypothetical protein
MLKISNSPFFTTYATRSVRSHQDDQLRTWQTLATPATVVGIGLGIDIRNHYAIQSHLVTSLEVYFFMTLVTPLASSGCDLWNCSRRATLAGCQGERYQ